MSTIFLNLITAYFRGIEVTAFIPFQMINVLAFAGRMPEHKLLPALGRGKGKAGTMAKALP